MKTLSKILVAVLLPLAFARSETPNLRLVDLPGGTATYLLHETNRGQYFDGTYKSYSPEFIFVIDIFEDPEAKIKTMTWSHVAKFGDKKFKKVGSKFKTHVKDIPAFIAPKKDRIRKPTSIYVGQTGTATVESFMIADEYFEYSKIGMGSVHLSSGKIIQVDWGGKIDALFGAEKSVILPSDTQKMLDSYLSDFPKEKRQLKLDATREIILGNERGFEAAYNASPESKAFVRSLMKKIIDYEYELENANLIKEDE